MILGVIVVAFLILWFALYPRSADLLQMLGELFGSLAVLGFSLALVLMSSTSWVEALFAGLDRAAIWHRTLAISGGIALAIHAMITERGLETLIGKGLASIGGAGIGVLVVWAMLPRWRNFLPRRFHTPIETLKRNPVGALIDRFLSSYGLWRLIHRLLGLFVLAGITHAALDSEIFAGSAALRWIFLAIGGLGIAFYVYRELFARFFVQVHRYKVTSVVPVGDAVASGMYAVTLAPQAVPLRFTSGQWAIISIETKEGWSRNPFTISSADADSNLTFTIKGLGDFTKSVAELVRPGMPAVVDGPHGRFNRRHGTARQLWIGAGVGITPFLSWVRSFGPSDADTHVDFFVVGHGRSPFEAELHARSAQFENLHIHFVDTAQVGRPTGASLLASSDLADVDPREVSVFMCGPEQMKGALAAGLHKVGIKSTNIHSEYFNWR